MPSAFANASSALPTSVCNGPNKALSSPDRGPEVFQFPLRVLFQLIELIHFCLNRLRIDGRNRALHFLYFILQRLDLLRRGVKVFLRFLELRVQLIPDNRELCDALLRILKGLRENHCDLANGTFPI